MLNVDLVGCASFCPHALKGQKLLAQGIALGNYGRPLSPCKGKSFKTCDCLSSNDSAKKVQTRTELSLLKLCRVQPFLNHDAKVRQFSDTTKFHPAELC